MGGGDAIGLAVVFVALLARTLWTIHGYAVDVFRYAAIDLGPRSVDARRMADHRDEKARRTACHREPRDAPNLRVMKACRLGFFADR